MNTKSSDNANDLIQLRPAGSDEIDLGELIANLLNQWRLICAVTIIGALFGLVVALSIPKQYRVEVIFDKPTNQDLSALLAQSLFPLTRQDVLNDFLKNLTSVQLIEDALVAENLLVDTVGQPLSAEQSYSKILDYREALSIAPAEFEFIVELDDAPVSIDQISYSLLSHEPTEAKTLLDSLMVLAASKTSQDLIADIEGARKVEIRRLETLLVALNNEATAQRQVELAALTEALSIANELGIVETLDWSAAETTPYLKGSRVLAAELSALADAPLKLGSAIVDYDEENNPIYLSAEAISGQLETVKNSMLEATAVQYIEDGNSAKIPASAEKPNRRLIVGAATLLAAFAGLFAALIRIALQGRN